MQVDAEKAGINHVVETKQMTDLAVNGRTFTLLHELLPGASPEPATGDEGGTGFNSSKVLPINGQRREANGFLVDGVENTDVGNSVAVAHLSRQGDYLRVQDGQERLPREYGTVGGANILVVTRTGTKELHGAAYEFLRIAALDAHYYFAQTKPSCATTISAIALGGPVSIPAVYNQNRHKTRNLVPFDFVRDKEK